MVKKTSTKVGKVIKPSTHQTGKSCLKKDNKRSALSPGKRISRSGKTYYENRKNRSDLYKDKPKLPNTQIKGSVFVCNGCSDRKTIPAQIYCLATGDTYKNGGHPQRCMLKKGQKDTYCIWEKKENYFRSADYHNNNKGRMF